MNFRAKNQHSEPSSGIPQFHEKKVTLKKNRENTKALCDFYCIPLQFHEKKCEKNISYKRLDFQNNK